MDTRNIFLFWTGQNKMSADRERGLDTIFKTTKCNVILVTPQNLGAYILKDYPFHKTYEYLSHTHKADYLRCYFMHHYGGGYTDIKENICDWRSYFNMLYDPDTWIIGYKEIGPHGVAILPGQFGKILRRRWDKLIGLDAFICKPKTCFTAEWYKKLHKTLDYYYDKLKENPATHPQERYDMIVNGVKSEYPIPWTGILGNIFHPLCLIYNKKIKQLLPPPNFDKNYR